METLETEKKMDKKPQTDGIKMQETEQIKLN